MSHIGLELAVERSSATLGEFSDQGVQSNNYMVLGQGRKEYVTV